MTLNKTHLITPMGESVLKNSQEPGEPNATRKTAFNVDRADAFEQPIRLDEPRAYFHTDKYGALHFFTDDEMHSFISERQKAAAKDAPGMASAPEPSADLSDLLEEDLDPVDAADLDLLDKD